ncbi:MAG TPA: 3-phosphoshikimate 1-carboxyvinyltransferase [Candidatus Salinicoccus stercoripullorum]|uniref:3-phosphoshikimate 1-carboxyvinyltransferase n=1 Tax=Candidatus Salinicoccus stercoripullorum TaxID=2838756 RepID=A0A9D1QG53_9STAP|nr:3-phosphoshikimate 1-carboxyvinyltransferase [Candidatus Salinicoccus stercoripullorum]
MKQLLNSTFEGTLRVPGDKSITHRSLMLAALAEGRTEIHLPLKSEDTYRTMEIMRAIGAEIAESGDKWIVESKGHDHLHPPDGALYTGNSGTTSRLIMGLLAGLGLEAEFSGDDSINRRPMDRVQKPLLDMGADIRLKNEKYPPVHIYPKPLKAIDYDMPVASAQVKSAVLLAGLFAEGTTVVRESSPSRDHSEIMMKQFGADLSSQDGVISLTGGKKLTSADITVPGDISSAAFPLALAVLKPGASITIENVSLNPTRSGILEVLGMMDANIEIETLPGAGEAIGNITASYTPGLRGFDISGEIIPRLIDEIPILALLAAYSSEPCTVSDAGELRFKETDRIRAVVDELSKFGINFEEKEDGFTVRPGKIEPAAGTAVKGYHDHRIIMMLIIFSLVSDTPLDIDDTSAIDISYPGFINDLESLRKDA